MARKSKCKKCSIEITKEEKFTDKGKSYCKSCYDEIIREKESYKSLINIICDYFNIDAPNGLILKQIKQYKDEFNYTNGGISYTLWYIKEIEGKSFDDSKYGIALVKYYYAKAEQYFKQQERIAKSVCKPMEKIREVKINLNKVYENKNKYTIDINELLGGE